MQSHRSTNPGPPSNSSPSRPPRLSSFVRGVARLADLVQFQGDLDAHIATLVADSARVRSLRAAMERELGVSR